MIVVASSGLNLPRELIAHCRIEETPHHIAVDGTLHDIRSIASVETLKEWVRTAKAPPYPLGSSAAEYVALFNELVKRTSEVLVVTGTRKILGTYDAAVAATRVVNNTRKGFAARVLDTGLVDLAAGLVAAYCGASVRAGHDMAAVIEAGQLLADASSQICAPQALDFLIRSGRPDLARSVLPRTAQGSPIIGMKDGEVRNIGTIAEDDQPTTKLVELLLARHKAGSALWVTITFGDDEAPARDLLTVLRRRFDVRYALVRQLGPPGYLFIGAQALMVSTHPVDAMKWMVRLPEAR